MPEKRQEEPAVSSPRYIVGIGASAGGLEALELFFSNMPADSNLGFVVIQHLSPDYKSLMVELLSKYTDMTVKRAEEGMPVKKNHVYLIPPRKNMTIEQGRLRLKDKEKEPPTVSLPINIFFNALARDIRERAIAVILSGTGSDGMQGVREIKQAGGMVMVQDENSAKFNGMPRSAISTGAADVILPPDEMPEELMNFVAHDDPATRPDPSEKEGMSHENTVRRITELLRNQTGVDFTYYKQSTFLRRIERRLSLGKVSSMHKYLQILLKSPLEVSLLYKDLLIGVTNFFRDTEGFNYLEENVIPEIMAHHDGKGPVRIWSAGCSTGEEAYSLAMLFHEHRERRNLRLDIKIFATDLDKEALDFAGNGIYPHSIAADIPKERLKRFFDKTADSFRVRRNIREMVVFASHNLFKDPPFTRMDLISCRNLLIYLQPVLQKKVLSLFAFSLNTQGFLFLGSSESVGDQADYFQCKNTKWKVYQSRGGPKPALAHNLAIPAPDVPSNGRTTLVQRQHISTANQVLEKVCKALMTSFSLCCVVVDHEFHLLYVLGDLSNLISFPVGEASLNLLKLVPRDLSITLSTALHRAEKEKKEVIFKNVSLKSTSSEKSPEPVNLRIQPVEISDENQGLYLIFIEEKERQTAPVASVSVDNLSEHSRRRIEDLEKDLMFSNENLQATIEELETANEELQASNEELLASNEELQSTNEELQSVNEELYTVNAEYQNKIQELIQLNNDINNLMNLTEAGTLFLDEKLHIRKFTPRTRNHLSVMDQDIGRPLSDMDHTYFGLDLVSLSREVLTTNDPLEKEVMRRDKKRVLVTIRPYLEENHQTKGVIISFLDVTHLKNAEYDLIKLEKEKDLILDMVSDMILYLNTDHEIIWANPAVFERFPLADPSSPIGKKIHAAWPEAGQHLLDQILEGTGRGKEVVNTCRPEGHMIWEVKGVPLKKNSITSGGIVIFIREIPAVTEETDSPTDHPEKKEARDDTTP